MTALIVILVVYCIAEVALYRYDSETKKEMRPVTLPIPIIQAVIPVEELSQPRPVAGNFTDAQPNCACGCPVQAHTTIGDAGVAWHECMGCDDCEGYWKND